MNKRVAGPALAALGFVVVLAPAAVRAQGYVQPPTSPYPHQPLSPYLNLLRSGSPAINYYGLVRPQTDLTNSVNYLQVQQQALANQVPGAAAAAAEAALLAPTGHPVAFLNYGGRFFNLGGGGFAISAPQQTPILGTGPLFQQQPQQRPMQAPVIPQPRGGGGNMPGQPGR